MASSVEDLVEQLSSPDFNARALALAELVQHGRAATAALTKALESSDERLRAQAAQGLAEIADPASAETFAQLLNDTNGEIRARGAQGLTRINDSRAIDALVRTINDLENLLHYPYTLSTYGLIQLGPPALSAVAPLLKSDDPVTRERAFLVIRSIVSQLPEGKDWEQLQRSLGSYNPAGTTPEREQAADQWLNWIKQHS
ncbi:MAG TPA: HEAT repeat domain-containing protein [Pyrinomonadaceae bacterium]|jgi:HEAT repeat protein|nr:HEAT repeat domain-containing protein [Pyrinomonadaceae bacterium]